MDNLTHLPQTSPLLKSYNKERTLSSYLVKPVLYNKLQPEMNNKDFQLGKTMKKINSQSISPKQLSLTADTFKLLIEATINYAIFILDANGFIQTWNPGATQLFDYEPEEVIGKHFSCLYTEKDIKKNQPEKDLQVAFEEGRCEDNNACRVKKNGTEFYGHEVITTLYSTNKESAPEETRYGVILHDLTERLKEEKKIKRMEATLKLFIENSKEYALYVMDPNGFIITWNKGAERIKGYKADEIIGKHFSQFFTEEDKNRNHPQEILKIAAKEGEYQEEGYRVRKDGTLFWANIVLSAIRDQKGKLINFGKISRDLTDRKMIHELLKKQNQELQLAKEQAEAASHAKSVFLSTMSHEIRTPLNSLAGMTELLLDTNLTEDQRQHLEIMRGSEKQLLMVINNILDFTKVESGPIGIETIEFNLPKLVNDLVKLTSGQAYKKGLTILLNIDEDVTANLKGDPLRIRQILNNLLDNAIKFTEKGKVVLNVKAENQGHHTSTHFTDHKIMNVLFEVIDTGIGISEEVKKKLFQPFVQGDPSISRKYGGSGLGLVISKKLAERMNGTLDVESKPGEGSRFWFKVPLIKGKDSFKENYLGLKKVEISDEDKKNFRILLAEDNITNREIALRFLKKFGYQADIAVNGVEVLNSLEKQAYDLILMDCQMPEMDGYTTTKKIRQMEIERGEKHIPIVAMTANALIGDKEKCLSTGMDDYLSKPINLKRFSEILEGWLSLKLTKTTASSRQL